MRRTLELRGGGSALVALCLASVLIVAVPSSAGAEDGEPCQLWVDEWALQNARQDAYPDIEAFADAEDAAWDALQRCEARHPGSTNFDGDTAASQAATPSASAVRKFTYTFYTSPYRGWQDRTAVRQNCHRDWGASETYEQWATRCISGGSLTPHANGYGNYPNNEQVDKTFDARAAVESWVGPVDWYDPPMGLGPNGEVRVPCTPGGNTWVRDPSARQPHNAKDPWADSGSPPPAGQICRR